MDLANSYNERNRLHERYFKFDVKQLAKVAASSCGRSETDIINLRKLAEGGFNRTFELTMRDGFQIVARLPYSSTAPRHYTIASEVATMDFVRLHGVPVPKIYGYSATSQNPIGSEYMILEKVAGKELGKAWLELTPKQRLHIVEQVVEAEALLFSIDIPANGSIYYKRDLPSEIESVDIPGKGSLDGFCIGPNVEFRWWYKERERLSIDRKPRKSFESLSSIGTKKLE